MGLSLRLEGVYWTRVDSDEWNNLNVQHIIIAIFVIGIVGLMLEWLLMALAKRFSFDD